MNWLRRKILAWLMPDVPAPPIPPVVVEGPTAEQHRSKYRRFEVKYVRRVPDPPLPTDPQAAKGAA